MLARECDLVDLVDAVQKRGALEKFYKLKDEALKNRPDGDSKRGKREQMSLEECILALVVGVAALRDVGPPSSAA